MEKKYQLIRLSSHALGRAVLETFSALDSSELERVVYAHGLKMPYKRVSLHDMSTYGELGELATIPAFIKAFSKANPDFAICSL